MATYEELKKKYPKMDDKFLRNHAVALKHRDSKDKHFESIVSKAIVAKKMKHHSDEKTLLNRKVPKGSASLNKYLKETHKSYGK